MDATEARAGLAEQAFGALPMARNRVVKRCRPWTGKWQMA